MRNSYEMIGCIDFETDSFAISIPILSQDKTNYLYIPKTDSHFIILDFYKVIEHKYKIIYLEKKRLLAIGTKTLIPITENGKVHILDPDWTNDDVRQKCPELGIEAAKAFFLCDLESHHSTMYRKMIILNVKLRNYLMIRLDLATGFRNSGRLFSLHTRQENLQKNSYFWQKALKKSGWKNIQQRANFKRYCKLSMSLTSI